jgi:hypothetical protein
MERQIRIQRKLNNMNTHKILIQKHRLDEMTQMLQQEYSVPALHATLTIIRVIMII